METRTITPFADQHADASTRRTTVKQLGALALGTLAIAAVGRSAAAKQNNHHNHNPHQNGQQECLNRCRGHNKNRCHQRCRRNRASV